MTTLLGFTCTRGTRITFEPRLRHMYDAFAHTHFFTCTLTIETHLHVTHAHTIDMPLCTHGCEQQSSSTWTRMYPSARCHSLPHTPIAQAHNMQPLFVQTHLHAHNHTHPTKTSKRGTVHKKHVVNCPLRKTPENFL